MFQRLMNWQNALVLAACLIVFGSIIYSRYVAGQLAVEERVKVQSWAEATNQLVQANQQTDTRLATLIITENHTIPIIETNERDSIVSYINIDSVGNEAFSVTLQKALKEFQSSHRPIELVISTNPYQANRYYYGESKLLKQLKYYPLVQISIIAIFIALTIWLLRSNYAATQNQVWAGMAKETAHQLGTPISSLAGWMELLKTKPEALSLALEMQKDIDRLHLISDRFGKIGSPPTLETHNIAYQIQQMIEYMRKRASEKVQFQFIQTAIVEPPLAPLSAPLFDWVIENLFKNALDAMDGKGIIRVELLKADQQFEILIQDTGKGIPKKEWQRIFKPGYSTKKRGWGLGLSLAKRIVETYHHGILEVKDSEINKGTIFRIVLKQ